MKLRNTVALANIVVVSAALALGGCTKKVDETGPEDEVLPTIKVELPSSPNFDEARAPVKWDDPDQSYSIYGLRKDIDDRLKEGESGKEVIVKGWVQEIYVPPECPEGQLCAPGKQPHFWITDQQDGQGKKRAMMVVNYYFPIPEWDKDTLAMWKDIPLVVVEVGKQYTIKGKFKRFSDTGFAHDNGLLEFVSYKVPNPDPKAPNPGELVWIAPPNSDWHPKTVQMQEEQNAKMMERMQKDAEAAGKK